MSVDLPRVADQDIYQALGSSSYDRLSPGHRERLAHAYTEIGVVYEEAGISTLAKIAALQAAWFRNALNGPTDNMKTGS